MSRESLSSQLQDGALLREAMLIGGAWQSAAEMASVSNPADGTHLASVPLAGVEEACAAVDAAHDAWLQWRELTPLARADYLWGWYQRVRDHRDDLALLMTLEQGKPLREAEAEVDYAASFIRWYAEQARRIRGESFMGEQPRQQITVLKQPIGVVAAITPWNFPAAMITRKVAPALAAGCCVVLKPALETPLTALALGELAQRAGIPNGVINIVTGDAQAIGEAWCAEPRVRALSFTGSTAVGRRLMAQSAPTLKRLALELGGNAPFIVLEDADLEVAISAALASKFRNSGQTCVCADRFYVHRSRYAEFVEGLSAAMAELRVGPGVERSSDIGPLISTRAKQRVTEWVAEAVQQGARLRVGGDPEHYPGLFYPPTLLEGVNESMRVVCDELFGPVVCLQPFSDETALLEQVNRSESGLAAYLFGRDSSALQRVSERLEVGMVGINTGAISNPLAPFGGVKQSGIGREGGEWGIEEFLEMKYLCQQF